MVAVAEVGLVLVGEISVEVLDKEESVLQLALGIKNQVAMTLRMRKTMIHPIFIDLEILIIREKAIIPNSRQISKCILVEHDLWDHSLNFLTRILMSAGASFYAA